VLELLRLRDPADRSLGVKTLHVGVVEDPGLLKFRDLGNESVHSCPYYYASERRTSSHPGENPDTGREDTS
jgi:hypothetical protein